MTARPVRVGTGAAYSEDRIDPGIDMAARGDLDYLVFEARVLQTVIDEAPLIWTNIPDASLGWTGALKGFETNVGGHLSFAGGGLTRAWLER